MFVGLVNHDERIALSEMLRRFTERNKYYGLPSINILPLRGESIISCLEAGYRPPETR